MNFLSELDTVAKLELKLGRYKQKKQSPSPLPLVTENSAILQLYIKISEEEKSHQYTKQQLEYTERILDSVKTKQNELWNQLTYFKSMVVDKETEKKQQDSVLTESNALVKRQQEEKHFLLEELNQTKQALTECNLLLDQFKSEIEKLKTENPQQLVIKDSEKVIKLQVTLLRILRLNFQQGQVSHLIEEKSFLINSEIENIVEESNKPDVESRTQQLHLLIEALQVNYLF